MVRIETNKVILTPLRLKQMQAFKTLAMDDRIKYMVYYPMYDMDAIRDFLLKSNDNWFHYEYDDVVPSNLSFSVVPRDISEGEFSSRDCIGVITLYFDTYTIKQCIELSWLLHFSHQGRGLMTEAVKAVMDWAQQKYQPDGFFACCDQRNESSRRLCERLNMRFDRCQFEHGREEYRYVKSCKRPSL